MVEVLEAAGVDTVFGVPGGAISPMYDALIDRRALRVIHVRHETNALFMSIGHARMRPGSVPCVLVTSGPGVTNAMTGLAAVSGEGVPVVVMGGEVPRSKYGRNALQEGSADAMDVLGIVRTVTRSAECIALPGRGPFQLASAIATAIAERGPVFLSVPLDTAVAVAPSIVPTTMRRAASLLDAAALEQAAVALRSAVRPLLLVGSGARGAARRVRAFAERFAIPVITSPKAKGIVPESASYCLGVFGYGGHPSSTEWLHAHPPDVVVALGCGLNEPSTNSWSPLLQASDTMIHVDLDAAQFGRNYRTDIAFLADAGAVLDALGARLEDRPAWTLPMAGRTLLQTEAASIDRLPLAPARVLTVLQEAMPADTVYTADIGEHLLFAIHYLEIDAPDRFITSLALGSMGSGIGAAIGAKLAAPERPVVSICGDWGFQMYGADLATCVQEHAAVVFLVMNDDRMRMVEAGVQRNYGRVMSMSGPTIDFAAVARAQGARGFTVRTVDELRRALRERSHDGPTVLDVRIDRCSMFPVNPRAEEISNFTSK